MHGRINAHYKKQIFHVRISHFISLMDVYLSVRVNIIIKTNETDLQHASAKDKASTIG
jgi:hypothetical protein